MNATSAAEGTELALTVRRLLQERASLARSRSFIEAPDEFDTDLWRALIEMGLTGLPIPEAYGGAGYGYQELCIVQEELGRVLAVVPYFSSICLGAPMLAELGNEEQKITLLPLVAAGETIVAVAIDEPFGSSRPQLSVSATDPDGQAAISGRLRFVIDGPAADLIIAPAVDDATEASALYLIPALQPGVEISPVPALDGTRKLADLALDHARGDRLGVLDGSAQAIFLRAQVCLAAEMLGGLEACLEMATNYAKVRHQFGRPIGSFQAIKHKCADMLVAAQSARSLVEYAAWIADESHADLLVAASASKAFCGDAYFRAAADNIQIHGGVGFTWEHDAQLYFKRAKACQVLLGTSRHHRSVIADHIGL